MYQPADNRVLAGARNGFTLVEVLIVVAILALVAAALVGVSNYIQTQGEIALTEQCVQLLSTAVAQFYDITGHYPIAAWPATPAVWDELDGSEFRYLGCRIRDANYSGPTEPNSDELLYLQLSILPQTRKIISKLPEELIAAPHDSVTVQLAHDLTADTPYLRSIVDPWGNALDYDTSAGGFPKIWSYGPDGESTTAADKLDDITNAD